MTPAQRAFGWLIAALYLPACGQTPTRLEPDEPRETVWRIGELAGGTTAAATQASPLPETASSTAQHRELYISLNQQRFAYREDGVLIRAGPISSGTPSHATPKGRFRVLSKELDKVSSRYTNQLGMSAWMPYAIQFHGHYFLHEGWLPGRPDSHGCVRLSEEDARFLFERLQLGDPILIGD